MNDEIKEFNEEKYVEMLENGELYDYITNLQQQLHQASLDIQELTERDIECPSWCDKLTNLQQENERLRNHIQMIPYLQTVREKDDYKSRIEKAVEYLKKPRGNYYRDLHYEPIKVITLIDILNGRSDE